MIVMERNMYDELMELYGKMAAAAYSKRTPSKDGYFASELAEFAGRAKRGYYDPKKEYESDEDVSRRQPMSDTEYAAALETIETDLRDRDEAYLEVRLYLAMAMGAMDAVFTGKPAGEFIQDHVRKAFLAAGVSGPGAECIRSLSDQVRDGVQMFCVN